MTARFAHHHLARSDTVSKCQSLPLSFSAQVETQTPIASGTHVYSDATNLKLDLRLPEHPQTGAPGVIFVHGGGFQMGRRDSETVCSFLDDLSRAGIASASISYRLTRKDKGFGCDVPVEEKQAAVQAAGEDLMQALNWLELNCLNGPDTWVAAGSSAGAETALWAGYIGHPDRWAGILSLSGALKVVQSTLPSSAFLTHNAHAYLNRHVRHAGLTETKQEPLCRSTRTELSVSRFRKRQLHDVPHTVTIQST